jgi:pimeloyl-ACP methyl ester carboxylesterase
VCLVLAGCAGVPPTLQEPTYVGSIKANSVLQSLRISTALEDRILAIDPSRISESDVRDALALGPTPHIVLLHGGLVGTNLLMISFAKFLVGMGYPDAKLRDPSDGAYSQSPYRDSARLAGELAWFYEHDGVRPMLIGHSQGGMQAVKALYELTGAFDDRVTVWNPLTDAAEVRTAIVDPLTGQSRPVVGLSVAYASAVGAGGAAFLLPNQWNMLHRLRTIPDSVDDFTGFMISGDLVAWSFPGAEGASRYSSKGTANVRNVTLPASYNHIFVPVTDALPDNPKTRDWINAYIPDGSGHPQSPDDVDGANILWAAEIWYSIKRHWCLEAQALIRAKRSASRH